MIVPNAKLADYAYYRTGGRCEALYAPRTVTELAEAVRAIRASGRPYFLLGGGTNSLVSDEDFAGAVIVFRELGQLERRGDRLVCGAGVENSRVAQFALQEGLFGASWMYRLPGQIGGTVRMNARCYGGEISQIVRKVEVVTTEGAVKVYEDPKVFRGYKDTLFMENGDLIANCEIELRPAAAERGAIEAKMKACESDREAKGQFDFPSCGCVFKNDYAVGVSSGILLDGAGAKALKHGGAEVSPHHANFVFNKKASSRAILEISFKMRELVWETYGVWLEYEMEFLGALPPDLAASFRDKRAHRMKNELLEPLRTKMRG